METYVLQVFQVEQLQKEAMMAKKTFDKRASDEAKEGYESVETGQPSGRFQDKKQVLSPDELGVAESSIPGTEEAVTASNVPVAKRVKSKMKIAPDVTVEELGSKQVGGVPLAGGQAMRSVAGLSGIAAGDDTSKTPYTAGGYRPDSRYGKKRSEDLFEMDNTISEQIAPVVDDAKDLAEDPQGKQGYNGRKQFKQVRGKKNFAFTNGSSHSNGRQPQQLLNESSLDFIHADKVVYSCGQMIDKHTSSTGSVVDAIDSQADYPTVKSVAAGSASAVAITMKKGNYRPTKLVITTANGIISGIKILEDQYHVAADPVTRDEANMNWQTDANRIAKSVVKLQKELGRETTDKWSPLGYVIHQPYQYNMLYHDIEATTGAIMALAYRSAVSSLAFQKNILAKDGVNPQVNGIKMIVEGYAGELETGHIINSTNAKFDELLWNKGEYRKGSAAAMIAMFDSLNKYKTKADLMGLQRSFGLHLSQCDNNLNPLHCKSEFIKALDKAHMFSTISGSYNPMLPIFATKRVGVINPLSLNLFLKNWKHPSTFTSSDLVDPLRNQETGTLANYSYSYKDIRNVYPTRVAHPIIEGLIRWLLKHEGAFVSTFGDNATINIPFIFDMQNPSLLSFMLCSAAQEILWARNIAYRDILFAGEQESYIWDDLIGLDKLNPLYSSQLTIGKYTEPLKLGKLAPDSALRELWGGRWTVKAMSSSKVEYFAPWYMNERAFGSHSSFAHTANEGFKNEPSAFNMTIPSVRDGVRHEYVDIIKSMTERDIRLALDREVDFMRFNVLDNSTDSDKREFTPVVNSTTLTSYVKASALRYEGNSDGRLVVTYDLTSSANRQLYKEALYSIPKELGFIDDLYDCKTVITAVSYSSPNVSWTTTTLGSEMELGVAPKAHAYDGFAPYKLQAYRVKADGMSSGSIDRSAALTQSFWTFFASDDATTINDHFVANIGIVPVLSYKNAAVDSLYGVYNLDSDVEASGALSVSISSLASRIWSSLQRFFMPSNPFEDCYAISSGVVVDPLESSFYFGVCGTLASDYTQDILERLDIYDQLGLDYTEDVFVKDSLLFR